jgi:hypothetical protein
MKYERPYFVKLPRIFLPFVVEVRDIIKSFLGLSIVQTDFLQSHETTPFAYSYLDSPFLLRCCCRL